MQFSAVAVNAKLEYVVAEVHHALEDATISEKKQTKAGRLLKISERKPFVIVASELVPMLESKWGVKLVVKKAFLGSTLENCRLLLDIKHSMSPSFNENLCELP